MLDSTTAADRRGLRLTLTAMIGAAVIPSALLLAAALGAPVSVTGPMPGELGIMPVVLVAGVIWQYGVRPQKQLKAPRR